MNSEAIIRLSIFVAVLIIMLAWEYLAPRRDNSSSPSSRRVNNLLLLFTDVIAVRLLFPFAAVGAALLAEDKGWGLFNTIDWNPVFINVTAVVLLDLLIYWQHVIFHKIPALWRIHRVHHTDPWFDVTTGVRFHPVEIILSVMLKMGFIILLGAPVLAVIIFEILLNAIAMFNHGNVRLPLGLDSYLRYLIVTPDMHRIHHSRIRQETDSNYGFCLPVWDRLFGSYRQNPALGHETMNIGQWGYDGPSVNRLLELIKQPFVTPDISSNINEQPKRQEHDR